MDWLEICKVCYTINIAFEVINIIVEIIIVSIKN